MKTNKTAKSIIEEIHPGESRARDREEDTKRGRGKHVRRLKKKTAKTSRRLRAEEKHLIPKTNKQKKQQQNNKTKFNSKLC